MTTADIIILGITMFGVMCLIVVIVIAKIRGWWMGRRNRAERAWWHDPRGGYSSVRTDSYDSFMAHIQGRHRYEFVRFIETDDLVEGGSFERAIQTDKMYMAAISAARVAKARGEIQS